MRPRTCASWAEIWSMIMPTHAHTKERTIFEQHTSHHMYTVGFIKIATTWKSLDLVMTLYQSFISIGQAQYQVALPKLRSYTRTCKLGCCLHQKKLQISRVPLCLSSWLTKHKLKYLNNKFSELIMKPYNIFNSIIKMITKHRIFSFSLYKQVKSRYKLYHVFSHFLMSLPERFSKNGGV